MKLRGLWVGGFITCIFLIPALTNGQESGQETQTTQPASSAQGELQTDWLWAEVLKVNPEAKELVVKYLDYDSDTEKEMTLKVDEKTLFENAQSINDIKPGDGVSIDYVVTSDNLAVAQQVSVEKFKEEILEEEKSGTQAPQEVPSCQ